MNASKTEDEAATDTYGAITMRAPGMGSDDPSTVFGTSSSQPASWWLSLADLPSYQVPALPAGRTEKSPADDGDSMAISDGQSSCRSSA